MHANLYMNVIVHDFIHVSLIKVFIEFHVCLICLGVCYVAQCQSLSKNPTISTCTLLEWAIIRPACMRGDYSPRFCDVSE